MLDAVLQDLRYSLRALRSKPGFAAVAILSLALGIGANTAIFSLINAVMLKSLPVHRPAELLQVMMGRQSYEGFSNPTFEHLRDRQDVFSGVFAYGRWSFNLANGGAARPVNGSYVTGNYFKTLGVRTVLGRTLTPADDVRGCPGGAVLSYPFWQREYAGSANALGRTISIDRHPIEIVGVAEPGFAGTEVGASADVFVPLCAVTVIRNGDPALLETNSIPVGWLYVIGRLKPGVTPAQAADRLRTLAPQIYRSTFDDAPSNKVRPEERDRYLNRTFDTIPAANGISYLRREYGGALMVLLTIVAVVLLIACANLANLLLARGAARRREIAIRVALGCGRGRLVRQFLAESLLLSLPGAAVGILVAGYGARLLARFLDASLDLSMDLPVLAFTVSVAVASGLLFGVAPAWRGSRVDPQAAMKGNARGLREGSRIGLGKLLVMAQVALSLMLLSGAGLMLATFGKLMFQDAGFDRDRVLLVTADLRSANYPKERWSAVYRDMLEQLRAVPGVAFAGVSFVTPVCHCRAAVEIETETYTPSSHADSTAGVNNVSEQYFATLGTSLTAGRDFNRHDTATSPKVAIVSQSLAAKFFAHTNPLGRRLRIRQQTILSDPLEIVGVVKDAKYGSLQEEPSPYLFLPWTQSGIPGPLTSFELRPAGGSPAALVSGVTSAMAAIDRDVSIQFQTLAAKADASIERERLLAALSGFFGAVALLLAAIGLYGVISHNVARRRNEIGIRMALGARPARVLRMVLAEVASLLGTGLCIGLGAALATTRLVAGLLYGVKANDPWMLAAAAVLLILVASIAGFLPARRASRLDPMDALREE